MFNITLRAPVTIVNAVIVAAATSQVLQASNRSRSHFEIQNTSDTVMWMNFGAVAAANVGISIAAGATWRSPPNLCPTNSINVIGATINKTFNYFIK